MAELDHIVIGARTLAQGEAFVREALGAAFAGGGAHAHMGTHNRVLRLGTSTYLEVIAIDPAGEKPFVPRWFGLDESILQAQLAERPRLIAWVARTTAMQCEAAMLPAETEAHAMQRGDLRWTFLFTRDGTRITHGLLPNLIAWGAGSSHPAEHMPDSGCTLTGLRGFHPEPQPINRVLAELQLNKHMVVRKSPPLEAPKLQAMIQTQSRGVVVLES